MRASCHARDALELVGRVAPGGRVVGVDIAAALLDRAREHAAEAGIANIQFQYADVQSSDLGSARFDGAFSRFGVMFFADPVAAFTNVYRSLKPGAVLSFVCWQPATSNDWMLIPVQAAVSVLGTAPEMPPPDAPGPFSLSDQKRVRLILDSAGFHNIDIKAHDDLIRTPAERIPESADSALRVGAVQRMLEGVDPETVQRVRAALHLGGLGYGGRVAFPWPLSVGSHDLIPVGVDSTHTVHLATGMASDPTSIGSTGPAVSVGRLPVQREVTPAPGTQRESAWQPRTLCGRPWTSPLTDLALDLLGEDRRLLCGSCWRTVEGWLSPLPQAEGEDAVVVWIVSTVLEVGEAMIDGVPVPRIESLRRRVRSELKAAVGGSVHTAKIGPTTMWVSSGVVNDAKTPERWQAEMRAGMQRAWAMKDGQEVEPPRWRRHWSEIEEPR